MPKVQIPNNWSPRPYQMDAWRYLEHGGRHLELVAHRRWGKDDIALHRAAVAMIERPATYWHMLPQAGQARKAIWDAVNPRTGRRRIDEAFPAELFERRETDMFVRCKNGATWQVLGSDNYEGSIGSPPAGIVYSEWAQADPSARAYLRPIIAENKGWEIYITTPRGKNHAYRSFQQAKKDSDSLAIISTADDTDVFDRKDLENERLELIALYGDEMGEALWRQEYYCDFHAPILGAVLGRQVDKAEADGRLNNVEYDPDSPGIEISSDIGFRDTASWWFWQRKVGGFSLIDYDEGTGLDADEWIDRLKERIGSRKLQKIWLPHDAKIKTFQSRHSSLERFLTAFGGGKVGLVPKVSKVSDRINPARRIIPRCEFNAELCEKGIEGLRSWTYKWDEERKDFSKDPDHNWASHPGDAFSYGCQVMEDYEVQVEEEKPLKDLTNASLDELWPMTTSKASRRI